MRRVTVTALTVIALCAPVAAISQECQQGAQHFRFELDGFVAGLYELSDVATQSNLPAAADLHGAVVEFDINTANLTGEELDELCALFERTPSLIESPWLLIDAIDLMNNGGERGNCPDSSTQRDYMIGALVFDLADAAAATACDVLGCLTIDWIPATGLACTGACVAAGVTDVLAKIAAFVVAVAEFDCNNEHSDLMAQVGSDLTAVEADVAANRDSITDKLDAALSSRATQASVEELDADLAALDGKVGNPQPDIATQLGAMADELSDQEVARQAFQDLDLRLGIEEVLQTGQAGRISLFQLPQAFGGRLEQVREVVASTITMNLDAGQAINNALHYFNLADASFNDSQYRDAFTNYQLAYQEAVKPPILGPPAEGDQR